MNKERLKAASIRLTNDILASYNEPVLEIKQNQKEISEQLDIIMEKADILEDKSQKYVELYKKINKEFKQVGDLVNFLETIEKDLDTIITHN